MSSVGVAGRAIEWAIELVTRGRVQLLRRVKTPSKAVRKEPLAGVAAGGERRESVKSRCQERRESVKSRCQLHW